MATTGARLDIAIPVLALGALLLAAGELVVDSPRQELVAHTERTSLGEHFIVQTGHIHTEGPHRRRHQCLERHAGNFHRILHRQEHALGGAGFRRQCAEVFAIIGDGALRDVVTGAARQHIRQGGF